MTITIERSGWRVVCEPRAEAYTEHQRRSEPSETALPLDDGNAAGCLRYLAALRTAVPRGVGLITLLNIFVFQFGFALLAPLMDILLAITLVVELRGWFLQPGGERSDTLVLLAAYWALFQVVDMLSAAVGLWLDPRPSWRLLPLVLLQLRLLPPAPLLIAIRTLLAAVKGRFVAGASC